MLKRLLFIFIVGLSTPSHSTEPTSNIIKKTANLTLDEAYTLVYQELEERNFYVVFETNIGKNISRFAEKWGDDYNRNNLSGIRSIVFCNGWYANKVGNADPDMLALCPMRLSVIEQDGKATVLFVRPTVIGKNSPALPVLEEIEKTVVDAINSAMN